jgi:alanine racemase
MNLRTAARAVKRSFERHKPLVEVGISRKNLLHNLHTYQQNYPNLKFTPVLKSNAYGHGLAVIAELLDKEDIAFFMVDSFYEARTLRRAGIKSRIAIIGFVPAFEIAQSNLANIDYAIVDFEQLRELTQILTKPRRVHLKIDTGMHRHGILPKDLGDAIALIHSNKNISVVGICSHFADADNPDPKNSLAQLEVWNAAAEKLTAAFPSIEYRHIAATKGVAFGGQAHTNVGRLGIGLYGFDTSPSGTTKLKPVLEMRSVISSIREVPPGDFVGYNATFIPEKPVRIATVPVGYFEGLDRALSNKGVEQVRGKECIIAGRVSMNMSSINVTEVPDAARGDVVTVISRNSIDTNSVEHMAEIAGTTPYVILVHIPQHLKRIVE